MTPSQTPCGVWRQAVAVVVSLWIYSFSPSALLVDGLFFLSCKRRVEPRGRPTAAKQRLPPVSHPVLAGDSRPKVDTYDQQVSDSPIVVFRGSNCLADLDAISVQMLEKGEVLTPEVCTSNFFRAEPEANRANQVVFH